MIQRIKRAATEFSTFKGLNFRTQTALLKNNADFVVSLRAAVFFEKNKQGLDQIVLALGINDYDFTKKLITDIKQQRINRQVKSLVQNFIIIWQNLISQLILCFFNTNGAPLKSHRQN